MEISVKLIECPRDAMQGWKTIIPTAQKVSYIQQLLKVGFDTIDFGSFVSEKAVPQMADTKEVIRNLSLENTRSKLLAIVANERGAREAGIFETISYLGYPFSISPTFLSRNTRSTIASSLETVRTIRDLCLLNKQEPVIYISMAFGNPYGDPYEESLVLEWVSKLAEEGIKIISLAD
ncbi:MAG: hydroxymethylglutaryl-CoA lyase, partial [Bacteroidota bacterium]|nr:hydroxymethylglutaryl-CoA lyase [Bacteroidota bacterium]